MDGENNGKPYVLMDDLGGKTPTIFGNIHQEIGLILSFQAPLATWQSLQLTRLVEKPSRTAQASGAEKLLNEMITHCINIVTHIQKKCIYCMSLQKMLVIFLEKSLQILRYTPRVNLKSSTDSTEESAYLFSPNRQHLSSAHANEHPCPLHLPDARDLQRIQLGSKISPKLHVNWAASDFQWCLATSKEPPKCAFQQPPKLEEKTTIPRHLCFFGS